VEILNTTKDERAFDYLVKALNDPDWWVRERAIDALANLGNKNAVPHLVDLLAEDNQTTPVAIRALAQLGDPRAVAPIMAKLKTRDEMTQREAVEAVGLLATPAQLQVVLQWLSELVPVNDEIRETAQRVSAELSSRLSRNTKLRSAATVSVMRPADALDAPSSVSMHLEQTLECPIEMLASARSNAKTISTRPDAASASQPAAGSRSSSDFALLEPGHVLGGRYRVIREIGRGGFGTVLQVADQMVGEEIAMKLINPELVQEESTIARFMHEVRYSRKITHENVIRVYDFLMVDSFYAISMEYFASSALSRRIRSGLHQQPARGLT